VGRVNETFGNIHLPGLLLISGLLTPGFFAVLPMIIASVFTITDSMTLNHNPFSFWVILNFFVFLVFAIAGYLSLCRSNSL
jgi:hypothetical protein